MSIFKTNKCKDWSEDKKLRFVSAMLHEQILDYGKIPSYARNNFNKDDDRYYVYMGLYGATVRGSSWEDEVVSDLDTYINENYDDIVKINLKKYNKECPSEEDFNYEKAMSYLGLHLKDNIRIWFSQQIYENNVHGIYNYEYCGNLCSMLIVNVTHCTLDDVFNEIQERLLKYEDLYNIKLVEPEEITNWKKK